MYKLLLCMIWLYKTKILKRIKRSAWKHISFLPYPIWDERQTGFDGKRPIKKKIKHIIQDTLGKNLFKSHIISFLALWTSSTQSDEISTITYNNIDFNPKQERCWTIGCIEIVATAYTTQTHLLQDFFFCAPSGIMFVLNPSRIQHYIV